MNCEPDADCAPAVGGDPVAAGYAFGRLCSWAVQEALVQSSSPGSPRFLQCVRSVFVLMFAVL